MADAGKRPAEGTVDEPQAKRAATSRLASLRSMTVVVADTGDIEAVKTWKPQDATTNPSLLLQAAAMKEYAGLLDDAVAHAKKADTHPASLIQVAMDRLFVNFGVEILKHVPGYVSTETDARSSFDKDKIIEQAHDMIKLYEAAGVQKDRVLIKIAATWEGIKAAEILEKEGIRCNLTLIFGWAQAVACAEAGVTLISPFVGRVLDWYKKATGKEYAPAEEPGVLSVKQIYRYYKRHGHKTIVMGASFRNIGEIISLAGCDRLTIAPKLMKTLDEDTEPLQRALTAEGVEADTSLERGEPMDEKAFRWQMNADAMATEKLAEGIRAFAADAVKLEDMIRKRLV